MTFRKLTSLDAQFLAMEDGHAHGHVSVLSTYAPYTADGRRLTAEVIRDLVAERLPLLPPFRWRLVRVPFDLDHPYWVDADDVDVSYHVQESALWAPGDDRRLADHVAEIIARPLDRSRPLWEIHVISGLADDSVALLIKMHHAAVDGVSGAEMLRVLLDDTVEGHPVVAPRCVEPQRRPSQAELLGRGLTNMCRYPARSVRAAVRALPHLDEVPTLRGVPGVSTVARHSRSAKAILERTNTAEGTELVAPRTRFQTAISPRRSVAFGSVSLAEVKAVKDHFGCSINDVVMAMCASGLRSWLADEGELPDGPLLSFVPVSVRTPEQTGTFGNRVSVMMAELPTDVADPVERLHRAQATMTAAKQRHQALPASLLEDANDLIPPALFARATGTALRHGASFLQPAVNAAISNVPGSPTTLYCAGAEQLSQFPISGILHGVGLNITVFSYRQELSIGIVVDRDQLDDPWPLLDAVRASLTDLTAAISTRPAV